MNSKKWSSWATLWPCKQTTTIGPFTSFPISVSPLLKSALLENRSGLSLRCREYFPEGVIALRNGWKNLAGARQDFQSTFRIVCDKKATTCVLNSKSFLHLTALHPLSRIQYNYVIQNATLPSSSQQNIFRPRFPQFKGSATTPSGLPGRTICAGTSCLMHERILV
jgi:hypothetical protein